MTFLRITLWFSDRARATSYSLLWSTWSEWLITTLTISHVPKGWKSTVQASAWESRQLKREVSKPNHELKKSLTWWALILSPFCSSLEKCFTTAKSKGDFPQKICCLSAETILKKIEASHFLNYLFYMRKSRAFLRGLFNRTIHLPFFQKSWTLLQTVNFSNMEEWNHRSYSVSENQPVIFVKPIATKISEGFVSRR